MPNYKVEEVVWVEKPPVNGVDHLNLLRELMSLSCLCPKSCPLAMDLDTGGIAEMHPNAILHWSRVFEYPWAILNADLKKTDYVLDAGGGHAVFQYALANRCGFVINIDKDQESLDAVEYMKLAYQQQGVMTRLGDLRNIDYEDNTFDKIFCISVVEHIQEWRKCVEELMRVLKPDGILILTLDIIFTGQTTNDFWITGEYVEKFLAEFGSSVPSGGQIISHRITGGPVIGCLCLKFTKE